MEKKVAKLFAVTGVVVGAAAALTPLTSYASDAAPCVSDPQYLCADAGPRDILLNVSSNISLDTAEGTGVINVNPNALSTGKISATVSSTQPYDIILSAAQPNLVKTGDATQFIAAGDNVAVGNNAWGIKKSGADTYTGLTTTGDVFYSHPTSAYMQKTELEVGVSVPYGTAPGSYNTEVTVIASPSTIK